MKKLIALMMALMMALSLAACGSKDSGSSAAPSDNGGSSAPSDNGGSAGLSGTVVTLGSTSMEKVINALGEQFGSDHSGVTVSVEGGGSGSKVAVPVAKAVFDKYFSE